MPFYKISATVCYRGLYKLKNQLFFGKVVFVIFLCKFLDVAALVKSIEAIIKCREDFFELVGVIGFCDSFCIVYIKIL